MDRMTDFKPEPTVLIVEDEALIAQMMGDALLDHGFAVQVVSNAGDALNYLNAGLPADALFTDINLPGGVDGEALAQLAREVRPNLPIVFASGRWSLLDRLQTMPRSACLPKPYSPARACAVIESLFATWH